MYAEIEHEHKMLRSRKKEEYAKKEHETKMLILNLKLQKESEEVRSNKFEKIAENGEET